MKLLFLIVLCAIWPPVYAGSLDSCATAGNILWQGVHSYKGPTDRAARIKSVIDQKATGLDNVLTVAVWFGYGDIVKKSLKDRDLVNKYGAQSLYLAASMGRLGEMSMLLYAGVSPNAGIHNGLTPIYGATEHGCVRAMQLLVDSGADVNHKANVGWTLMEDAVISKQFDAARFLMEHGYNASREEKSRVRKILQQISQESKRRYIFGDKSDSARAERG